MPFFRSPSIFYLVIKLRDGFVAARFSAAAFVS
jgi:hypothetical protein